MTTNDVMVVVERAGSRAVSEFVSGLGVVVIAKRISHPCGHREDVGLVPANVATAHEVRVVIDFERRRDCANCRMTEFVNFRLGGER